MTLLDKWLLKCPNGHFFLSGYTVRTGWLNVAFNIRRITEVTKKQALTPSVLIDLNYISWDSEFKFSRLIEGSIQFFVLPVPSLSYWRSYSQ